MALTGHATCLLIDGTSGGLVSTRLAPVCLLKHEPHVDINLSEMALALPVLFTRASSEP